MFASLPDKTLRAAHDAARLLYEHHRVLGLGPDAIKLDTLRVDITVELENRGTTPPGDRQSAYHAARAALTARYAHLALTFTPAPSSASGQHEATWDGGTAAATTEDELLALVRAAMGDCGSEGHLWATADINRDPASPENLLITQHLECDGCPPQKRVITLHHPQPTPAEAAPPRQPR
jgi:hypothetical protein